jgi:hypothetical protein
MNRARLKRLQDALAPGGVDKAGRCNCGLVVIRHEGEPLPEVCPRCGLPEPEVRVIIIEVVGPVTKHEGHVDG